MPGDPHKVISELGVVLACDVTFREPVIVFSTLVSGVRVIFALRDEEVLIVVSAAENAADIEREAVTSVRPREFEATSGQFVFIGPRRLDARCRVEPEFGSSRSFGTLLVHGLAGHGRTLA
jgi:hypothetical protein